MRWSLLAPATLLAACWQVSGLGDLDFRDTGGGGDQGPLGGTPNGGASPGAGGGGMSPRAFVDESKSDFDEGIYTDTAYTTGRVVLQGASAGSFRSRVFDATEDVPWTAISWRPGAPYGKPLPVGGGAESGYAMGNVDMRDNVLLLGFDGRRGAVPDGAVIADGSPRAIDMEMVGVGASRVPGQVGEALSLPESGVLTRMMSATGPLNFGSSDFTISMWVKTSQPCPDDQPPFGNRVYLGAINVSGSPQFWFGCSASDFTCGVNDGQGRAGGTYRDANGGGSICGTTVINDDQWHHMAVTRQGENPSLITVFVDGAQEDQVSVPIVGPMSFDAGTPVTVGGFSPTSDFQAAGAFDEIAVWRTALSAEEIGDIHRRGRLDLQFRVRTCVDAACADDPAFSTDVSDPSGASSPGSRVPLNGQFGRYIQYEVSFRGVGAARVSPELYRVELHAR